MQSMVTLVLQQKEEPTRLGRAKPAFHAEYISRYRFNLIWLVERVSGRLC